MPARMMSAFDGVRTAAGDIACEKLVLCCGQWTRELAQTIGVTVPLISVEHQYMLTEAFGVPTDLPTLRDPDRLTYYKEEVGGLIMGGYEPNGIPWAKDGTLQEPGKHRLLLLEIGENPLGVLNLEIDIATHE